MFNRKAEAAKKQISPELAAEREAVANPTTHATKAQVSLLSTS